MIESFSHSAATAVERSGERRVDGVLSPWMWSASEIAYSDPDGPSDYGFGYDSDVDGDGASAELQQFAALRPAQRSVMLASLDTGAPGARAALAGFAADGFSGLELVYAGRGSGDAEIRVANSGDAAGAYAYLPDPSDEGGDVWLGGAGGTPEVGDYDFLIMVHELGHALGLEHGHSSANFGAVPTRYDSLEYTVMTYRSFVGATTDQYDAFERYGAPQGFMMLDVAALQHMYGANFAVNAGDTVYSWRPGSGATRVDGEAAWEPGANRIFATIWDGGGTDTYDMSRYGTDLSVDLRPGRHSVLDARQLSHLGGGPNDGYARGNVFNALQYRDDPRSLIERAKGGDGADALRGNAADNLLNGRVGADVLIGFGGDDALYGGRGRDVLVGGDGADVLVGGPGPDVLKGGAGPDVFRFAAVTDSTPGNPDRIAPPDGAAAFAGAGRPWGDVIDLSAIDANRAKSGNQAFKLADAPALGSVWLRDENGDTRLLGRVDRRKDVDFKLEIDDGAVRAEAYGTDDFIL